MPTLLPNGVMVFNLTPHDLVFGTKEGQVMTTAPSDGVVNAEIVNEIVEVHTAYELTTVRYRPMRRVLKFIEETRAQYPNAVLVGSSIAAMTYRGELVAAVPVFKDQAHRKRTRLVRPDLFTTYLKENSNHG